ncbi:hypothetical protein GUITHDRAFT_111146 [Guillardia theta CCMP2712]|uniref:RWP-RK domain-containing protein n=1 Tax=Guillardia theta (strain CCMP2712) TaxID=905079 RepID=L1J2Q7_GUITC|nr:hypothetical protein GUITHDRAFT_111146 [Guillardia theta CCMP2712]EKX42776.1 hypothetical protein GUITHDRAFT_111146 [Guillardia theta CCMP2712]|eukprot:XP_005829756.1 hypothetical protein GUITHDRAFT_111146 [Guillardia theta CCMP2712]
MASVSIAPRPRPGSSAPSHVSLSLQALSPLFHTPQDQAAHVLGISLTSLKSACRRLGISRWPYKRGGNRSQPVQEAQQMNRNAFESYEAWLQEFLPAQHRQDVASSDTSYIYDQKISSEETGSDLNACSMLVDQENRTIEPEYLENDNNSILHLTENGEVVMVNPAEWIDLYLPRVDDDIKMPNWSPEIFA